MLVDTVVSNSGGSTMGMVEPVTAKVEDALALLPLLSLILAVIICVLSNGEVTWKLAPVEFVVKELVWSTLSIFITSVDVFIPESVSL